MIFDTRAIHNKYATITVSISIRIHDTGKLIVTHQKKYDEFTLSKSMRTEKVLPRFMNEM